VTLTRRLIENDILVVDTGCVAVANAKGRLQGAEAAEMAGPGFKEVCNALGIPPVLHMGSCVDNVRILVLCPPWPMPWGGHQRPARGRLGAGVVF
jgi:carbon-monoxide dehydrogenase catalytic subunit